MILYNVTYPENLPVSQSIQQLKTAVLNNQVIIVCGETGSGKTTQLPKLLLELGFADNGLIGHTQPRKIAAKTLSRRIGEELNNFDLVGHKVRFHDRTTSSTRIKLMTDGILLQEIQTDKFLRQYSALIIDEAHERSLNIDFILGYLKTILIKRPDLKVIITSATIDNQRLSKFFNNAPIVDVKGKTYPVDIIYQKLVSDDEDSINLNQAIYNAIKSCFSIELGNALVFLPGEQEIRDCLSFLRKSSLSNYNLLPLFSRQNESEQNLVFLADGTVKIIITTNVAETSLTIPGIRYVIDSGLARIKRYNTRLKVEQLLVENIAKANSQQRAGRAGRVSHGMCIRLFGEDEFNLRQNFADPEILRSNLANVILKLISFKLGDPLQFPFLDMPENKAFNDGFKTLFQLGAITAHNTITPLGLQIAKIPLDCNLARMLVAGGMSGVLSEILIIVAFLAIIDPRQTPVEFQQQAQQKHQLWASKQSDFIAVLNLWYWYQNELQHKKSHKKLVEHCRVNFLSFKHLREWVELHNQLKEVMTNLGFKVLYDNKYDIKDITQPKYEQIHKALLTGLLNNIGQKDLVESFYLGTNAKKFVLHPSSLIIKAKWVVSANLMHTSRLYARTNAYIEPVWLVPLTKHLVKYTYSEEFWDQKRGEAVAMQSAVLFGLIIERKKVSYSNIDPYCARELFIRHGLVACELNIIYPFIEHNQSVIRQIDELEDKLRFSLVIAEEELFKFYAKHLPDNICDVRTFTLWYKDNADKLKLNPDEFIQLFNLSDEDIELYPDYITVGGEKIQLKYIFNPDNAADGVTAIIDHKQLSHIEVCRFSWLVPGLIREKITYLIKSLPKNIRTQLNPLNESISNFLQHANTEHELVDALVAYLATTLQLKIDIHYFAELKLPLHLVCHFQVYMNNKLIDSGDDLNAIKQRLIPKSNPKQDVFNQIKAQLQPQLRYIEQKKLVHFNEICLYLADIDTNENLLSDCITYLLRQSIDVSHLPATSIEFDELVNQSRINFSRYSGEFTVLLYNVAKLYQQIKLLIINHPLYESIVLQLDDLIYSGFLRYTSSVYLAYIPRYLQAIIVRLNKYANNQVRDAELEHEINLIYDAWYNYVDRLEATNNLVPKSVYLFKYKIEELRVSLFAQELKTPTPVSSKRLWRELDELPGFSLLH